MRRRLIPLSALGIVVAGVAFWSGGSPEQPPQRDAPPPAPREEMPAVAAPIARTDLRAPRGDSFVPDPIDAGLPEAVVTFIAPIDSGSTAALPALIEPPPELLASPPLAIDASATAPNDPRFTIRWGKAGLCGDEPLERMSRRRAALLATFIGVRRAGTLVFRDPDASPAVVDLVGDSLAQARVIVTRLLGPRADVALPVIYVYASAEQMRDVACVNTATAGYYDGAIHLPASDPDAYRTVVHEHVHHVLNALGLRKPMWFHEGLAMYAADERWWEDPRLGLTTWLRSKHLPFPALVEAFPHTADELFAGAAYYQSYMMVSFLAARTGRSDFGWFVDALVSGRLNAQTSLGEGVGLTADQLESAWGGYVQSR